MRITEREAARLLTSKPKSAGCEPRRGGISTGSIRSSRARYGELTASVKDDVITLTFPEPTPSVNLLHGHHWGRKLKERAKWGRYVDLLARQYIKTQQIAILCAPEVASVRFCRYGARLLDPSNLVAGMKWLEDALVTAGFILDDSPAHYIPKYEQRVCDERKTVVSITSQ